MQHSLATTVILSLGGALLACGPASDEPGSFPAVPPISHAPAQAKPASAPLAIDTPATTAEGSRFIAPAGWRISLSGSATILEPPEGGSHIALIDVHASSADDAVAAAWNAYKPAKTWPLEVVHEWPDEDGWADHHEYLYETSPSEKRSVSVDAMRAGDAWTVVIYDMDRGVAEKRAAQIELIYDELLPKDYVRESFANEPAHELDAAHVATLTEFVERSMQTLRIPGAAVGVIQGRHIVFAKGFGVRELGEKTKVDADTLFMIGSNTKALTTLMLAKLVDAEKLSWDTPVTRALPSFRLGDAATTERVEIKHLVCACTGLPRQDMESIMQFDGRTPAGMLELLATMQPTSAFGELFQYSNVLAAAAGYVGGHLAYPSLELGAAYDHAMQRLVFDPLGMTETTFDYARALSGNHASPHALDLQGDPRPVPMDINYYVIPQRPAGAAWSSLRDMLRYVRMELDEGALPDGTRYISREALDARRAPQVSIGKHVTYGMGLEVDTTDGVVVVHHGGASFGYLTDMIWLPEHGVGAVVLTNRDLGEILMDQFRRKLLEVLFDGHPEADAEVETRAKAIAEELAAQRALLHVPADAAEVARLASRYANDALGSIVVRHVGDATFFDFGEWSSEVASRRSPDGSLSFVTISPGPSGLEFVVGEGSERTLLLRRNQHEYLFRES